MVVPDKIARDDLSLGTGADKRGFPNDTRLRLALALPSVFPIDRTSIGRIQSANNT